MKKIYTMVALFASFTAFAQSDVANKVYNPLITKSALSKNTAVSAARTSIATCGPDTISYPYTKEYVFSSPNDSIWADQMIGNVRTASQGYRLNDNALIHGVQFFGAPANAAANPNRNTTAKVYLYNVDANFMPTTAVDSATVFMNQGYNYYTATFPVPHAMNSNYAVGVKTNVANDTLVIVYNNAGAAWQPFDYSESLGWRRFGSGVWNTNLAFLGQDAEYLINPIISYTNTADFMATNATGCVDSVETFMNMSSPIAEERMYNLNQFNVWSGATPTDTSFFWNYGDAAGVEFTYDGAHTYTAPGTYTVTLNSLIVGYYTNCMDTKTIQYVVSNCTPVGIADASAATKLSANFNNGILSLNVANGISTASVYDAIGNVVYAENGINTAKKEINLSNLANGVYFVRVNNANTVKFTVAK
jgi:hypothetical protein